MIFLYQLGGLQVDHGFPGVIAFGVALPFDQVLQLSFPSMTSVASDGLDFVLFSPFYQFQGWPRVVLAVFFCFDERGKERRVKDRVYCPLWGQAQPVGHRGDHLSDLEGPMMSGGEFHRPIWKGQVLCFEPHPLP
jgi:hypothetical protein